MEQDLYLQQERERRLAAAEKQEHERGASVPLALTKPHGEEPNSFHRPFENLANGYDANHYDYERKLMTEAVLAQDRQILQEHHRLQAARQAHGRERNHEHSHNHVDKYDKPHHEGKAVANHRHKSSVQAGQHTQGSHHSHPHKEYINNYHKPEEDTKEGLLKQSVTSKLDLEEKLLKKVRQGDSYNSENSDSEAEESVIKEEEQKRQRCMLIASGPPLQLDRSPAKMKYLKQFKLTTRERRHEMDYQRRRKRRKMYREPSISPVEMEEGERCSPLMYPSPIHPDSLNREPDYKHKVQYLRELKLQPVPPEKRRGTLQHIFCRVHLVY